MKCTDINRHIDDYLDSTLNPRDLSAFEQHVSTCSACADGLAMAKTLAAELRQLPVPEHTADFEQRVFTEVRRAHKDDHKRDFHFATGFATAAVASVAIWFAASLYVPDTVLEQPQMITVALNQSQMVSLVIDSHADIQQADLSIDLPVNMELYGYPGQRTLAWQASLKKGQNILEIPVMAIGYGQGELHAQVKYNSTVTQFSVVLKTAGKKVAI